MNAADAQAWLPLIKALAAGKIIQEDTNLGWSDTACINTNNSVHDYRIKPALRPWATIDEVPVGCNVYRDGAKCLITGAKMVGGKLKVYIGGHNDNMPEDILREWKLADDAPCGTMS